MILRRYIIHQLASTTAIVVGFLVFLLLGGRLIKYFGKAAEGNLDTGVLFSIIGYNLPFFLELILPLSFFISLMLVFGRLYVDQEMAVINSSGMSRGRIARLATPFIVLLFIFEAWLSMVGKPWGVRNSETIWQEQAVKSAFDLIQAGEFISSGDFHLYVGSVSEDRTELRDIILIQESTANKAEKTVISKKLNEKDTIILAKSAKQVSNYPLSEDDQLSESIQLELFNGRRYQIGADNQQYNQASFQRYRLTIKQPEEREIEQAELITQPTKKVWQIIKTSQGENKQLAQAELGYRLALPWLIIISVIMSIPLAQVKPRKGRWLRLIPSILLFLCVALSVISIKKPIGEGKASVWLYLWLITGLISISLYAYWADRINQRMRFRLKNQ